MNDHSFIIMCAIIAASFVIVLDQTFIVANTPPKHIVFFHIDNMTVVKYFDCDPQYLLDNSTIVCTNGDLIRP